MATAAYQIDNGLDATWEQVGAAIAGAADETPAELWIYVTAGPAIVNDSTITKDTLDKLAPGRKVFINAFTGHNAVLSSAALAALNIPADAKDPMGGAYGRDANGKLNGRLFEYAHYDVDRRFADLASIEELASHIAAFSEEAIRYGITSVQAMTAPSEERFEKAMAAARVPLRVRMISFPLGDLRSPKLAGRGAVKFILDGTPIERGAALRTARYPDDTHGRENFADLAPLIKLAVDNQQQLLVHAAGDKTAESVLKAVATTSLSRVRLEHADGLQRDLWPLTKRTGAIAVVNPTHFPFRGTYPRGEYMLAASLLKAGIPLAIGSDGPMNPYLNIMLAAARPDQPDESISREDALRAYTSGSAFAENMETKKGKIALGMLADIAVLSQNILEIPMETLPETRSVLTIIDGKVVYEE